MADSYTSAADLARDRLTWEHTLVAFALSGPYHTPLSGLSRENSPSTELPLASILLLFRSLLTTGIYFQDPTPEPRLLANISRCSEKLPAQLQQGEMLPSITFSADRSATPEERNEHYAAAKNRLFFGIGDTLGFLAAAVLAQKSSSSFGKDELGSIAYDTSFDLLAGHPKRKDFQSWVDQSTNETRSATLHDETFDFAVLVHLQKNERGSFWHRWYQGFLDGKPLDWELQRRVALIDDAIWEAGPEAVAQEIARIEAEFEAKPLDQDALRSHLTNLVETPLLFADSAESVSTLTTEAITRFKRDAETNQLPDGFAVFEQLPGVFGQISITLRSDRDIEEKTAALQDEVNRLNALVGQLRLDLADARLALAEALLSPAEAQRTRTFGERLQMTLTNVTLIGAIGISTLGFFGVEAKDLRYEALKESLQGLAKDMETVAPAPKQDTLTPPVDV